MSRLCLPNEEKKNVVFETQPWILSYHFPVFLISLISFFSKDLAVLVCNSSIKEHSIKINIILRFFNLI